MVDLFDANIPNTPGDVGTTVAFEVAVGAGLILVLIQSSLRLTATGARRLVPSTARSAACTRGRLLQVDSSPVVLVNGTATSPAVAKDPWRSSTARRSS